MKVLGILLALVLAIAYTQAIIRYRYGHHGLGSLHSSGLYGRRYGYDPYGYSGLRYGRHGSLYGYRSPYGYASTYGRLGRIGGLGYRSLYGRHGYGSLGSMYRGLGSFYGRHGSMYGRYGIHDDDDYNRYGSMRRHGSILGHHGVSHHGRGYYGL